MKILLPCPLCKGEARLSHYTDCFSAPFIKIRCQECGLSLTADVDMRDSVAVNEARAIEKWNRRVDVPLCGEVGGDWHTELPTQPGNYLVTIESLSTGQRWERPMNLSELRYRLHEPVNKLPVEKVIAWMKYNKYIGG